MEIQPTTQQVYIARIIALAKLIKEQPHTYYEAEAGFTMLSMTHPCGTPGCIAGWAAYVANNNTDVHVDKVEAIARAYLGISELTASELFYPLSADIHANRGSYIVDLTPKEAHDVLMHLAETGNVDLSILGYEENDMNEWTKV